MEEIPYEAKAGGVAGLLAIGLAVVRMLGLRASKDLTTLKADSTGRAEIVSMQTRVELMDARITHLEAERLMLLDLIVRQMAYIGGCECGAQQWISKDELQADYRALMDALRTHNPGKEKNRE